MAQYRKKPEVIEAWRNLSSETWPAWVTAASTGTEPGDVILIQTPTGIVKVALGDWVFKTESGEVYSKKHPLKGEYVLDVLRTEVPWDSSIPLTLQALHDYATKYDPIIGPGEYVILCTSSQLTEAAAIPGYIPSGQWTQAMVDYSPTASGVVEKFYFKLGT